MSESNTIVCFARTIQEVLYQLKTVKDVQIIGGCTGITTLPHTVLPIRTIQELSQIQKHERYLDFGPAVTLSQILAIGKKNLPPILYDAVKTIANPAIRNMATIGGNICSQGPKKTLYAPLLALGARLEFINEENSIHQSITQFKSVPDNYIFTNIRIPTDDWDVSVYKKLWGSPKNSQLASSFAFLAKTERSILTNVRIAYTGPLCFRSIELENNIIGSRLPLPPDKIAAFITQAEEQYNKETEGKNLDPIIKQQFLQLVAYSFEQLT